MEEQHEKNMLYLWKNLCFTHTDDATGTNSSWFPPYLSVPALAAYSWLLAKNSGKNTTSESSCAGRVDEEIIYSNPLVFFCRILG